jgi:hypothetical protein
MAMVGPWLCVCGSIALLAVAGGASAADGGAPPPPPPLPACVQVTTASRYVPFGYNHFVVLTNGCSKPASCVVSTDVNPERQTAVVAPTATVEVTTFLGAAASTFVARVECRLQ